MADDLANLGVVIEERGGEQAIRALDGVAKKGAEAEQATRRLTGAQQELVARSAQLVQAGQNVDIQNKKAVASYLQQIAEVRAVAQQMGALSLVEAETARAASDVATHTAAVTAQMKALRAEQAALGTATGLTSGGLNSMRASLTSMVASLAGTAPGMAQFTGALGTMAVGSGVMIGALAGLAAISFAWDKISEKARKAAEEQDKAVKVLAGLREKEENGPAGDVGRSTAIRAKALGDVLTQIQRLEKEQTTLNNLQKGGDTGEGVATEQARVERRLRQLRAQEAEIRSDIARGSQASQQSIKQANEQEAQQNASALAQRLSFNQKDEAARKAALATLARDRAEYARLLKLPNTPDNSREIASVASEMKQLDEALNPKARGQGRDASQARTIANIAEQEERRVAAAQALNAAAQQGQAAYDREVRSQALQNQLLETEQRIRAQFLDTNGKQRAGTEAAMNAEIARARAAITAQDELGQKTRATLSIETDETALAVLKAKTAAYQTVGASVKDATVEQEYAVRVSEAMAVADEAQRAKKLQLAAAIRDQTIALHGAEDAAQKQKQAAAEAQREQERQIRQVARTVGSTVTSALDSIGEKGSNIVRSILDAARRGTNRLIGDAVGQLASQKFAEMFGVGPNAAATKQVTAGATMLAAANTQLAAANAMLAARGLPVVAGAGGVGATGVGAGVGGASLGAIGLSIGAAATGGGLLGNSVGGSLYSQSHGAFGNYARGAIGGAIGGAAGGAAIGAGIGALGGPITAVGGAVVGGITGLIGGLLGIGSASKEAAKQTAELRKALSVTMAGLAAEVGKDALAAGIAQVEAQREQIRKQIEDAYAGGGANSDTVRERNKQLAELNRLEDERIRQLKEEAATIVTRQREDYRVRELRAQGKTAEADALAFQEAQQRERQDLITSFGPEIDANEQATLAALDAALAAEKLAKANGTATDALDAFSTAVRNAPTGFKLEPYIQQYANGSPLPGSVPLNPLTPSTRPNFNTGSTTGMVASAPVTITVAPGAIVVNESKTPQLTADAVTDAFLTKLDAFVAASGGINIDRATALNRLPQKNRAYGGTF